MWKSGKKTTVLSRSCLTLTTPTKRQSLALTYWGGATSQPLHWLKTDHLTLSVSTTHPTPAKGYKISS